MSKNLNVKKSIKIKNWINKLVCCFLGHKPHVTQKFPYKYVSCSRCDKTIKENLASQKKYTSQPAGVIEPARIVKPTKKVLSPPIEEIDLEPLAISKNEPNANKTLLIPTDLIDYSCSEIYEDENLTDVSLEECITMNLHGRSSINGYCTHCGELSSLEALSYKDALSDSVYVLLTLEECKEVNLHKECVDEDGCCVHCGENKD